MHTEVVHETDAARYVILVDDVEGGELTYELRDDEILFTHTFVDPVHRGLGLAAILVRSAIDDVLATSDRRITSGCWYVTEWLGKHPNYVSDARSGGIDALTGNACRIVPGKN
ncbi:MAG: N-acetyltransferase [Microbacteriaceae bacterium]|nr:N-acetyltransferase [Microbacteriaceae bacterium]